MQHFDRLAVRPPVGKADTVEAQPIREGRRAIGEGGRAIGEDRTAPAGTRLKSPFLSGAGAVVDHGGELAEGGQRLSQRLHVGLGLGDLRHGLTVIADTDESAKRVKLMDTVDRKPVISQGSFDADATKASTYKLVGPEYFNFFALIMGCVGVLFIFVAYFYKERTHVREAEKVAP